MAPFPQQAFANIDSNKFDLHASVLRKLYMDSRRFVIMRREGEWMLYKWIFIHIEEPFFVLPRFWRRAREFWWWMKRKKNAMNINLPIWMSDSFSNPDLNGRTARCLVITSYPSLAFSAFTSHSRSRLPRNLGYFFVLFILGPGWHKPRNVSVK